MDNELLQLLISGKLGDGSFINQRKTEPKTYRFATNSINADYLNYKKSVCDKYGLYTIYEYGKHSGYNPDRSLYSFRTKIHNETTYVGRLSVESAIELLDKLGLIYYYLDDGSLHKRKHFMHLYCNTFTDHQAQLLADIIWKYYPQKRCTVRYEHKKDGRVFAVIYIPVVVATEFSKDVRDFLLEHNISSLLYKTIGD